MNMDTGFHQQRYVYNKEEMNTCYIYLILNTFHITISIITITISNLLLISINDDIIIPNF